VEEHQVRDPDHLHPGGGADPSGDPWNQSVFAAPMVVLYLLSIGIAWAVAPRRKPAADQDA
jgi:Sec-independent protein secretion pathway component TatC